MGKIKSKRRRNILGNYKKHFYTCSVCNGDSFVIINKLFEDCPQCDGGGNFIKGDFLSRF